jgi:hypothetical protein
MINQGLQRNRSSGLVAAVVVMAVVIATYLVLPEALRSSTKVVLSLQAASVAIFGLSVVGLRGLPPVSAPRAVGIAIFLGFAALFIGRLCEVLFPASVAQLDWPGVIYLLGVTAFAWAALRAKAII